MANNKDFVFKGVIEIGGSTKVTIGSITSNAIDLATGNYFTDTLSANTTYTITNPGAIQSFELEVTGASTYVITWPTTIGWPDGIAPLSPDAGKTDVFTFTTDDTGTSYAGVKSIRSAG
tara:strand:+ start:325 stop:681 length:357 start_codon:yes stop_codon:yes gene_type:complete